jgi:RimJ/RimL family protein N-acetyltransferase
VATRALGPSTSDVRLRDVTESDLPVFFAHQLDPDANRMAALTARDRAAFMAHWANILDDGTIAKKTVLVDGQVAGNVLSFDRLGEREVGYWIGREYWGKGVATRALAAFLEEEPTRPLYARVAKENVGSIRVLEKCGFTIVGEDRGDADGRGPTVEEVILSLGGRWE